MSEDKKLNELFVKALGASSDGPSLDSLLSKSRGWVTSRGEPYYNNISRASVLKHYAAAGYPHKNIPRPGYEVTFFETKKKDMYSWDEQTRLTMRNVAGSLQIYAYGPLDIFPLTQKKLEGSREANKRPTPITGRANVEKYKQNLGVCMAPGCHKISGHDGSHSS